MKKWVFIFSLMFYCITINANIYENFNGHSIGFVDTHFNYGEKYSPLMRKRYSSLVNKQLYEKQAGCAIQLNLSHLPLWCKKVYFNKPYSAKPRHTAQHQPYVFEITLPTKKQQVRNGADKQPVLRAQINPLLSKKNVIVIGVGALVFALLQVYFCWRQTRAC